MPNFRFIYHPSPFLPDPHLYFITHSTLLHFPPFLHCYYYYLLFILLFRSLSLIGAVHNILCVWVQQLDLCCLIACFFPVVILDLDMHSCHLHLCKNTCDKDVKMIKKNEQKLMY